MKRGSNGGHPTARGIKVPKFNRGGKKRTVYDKFRGPTRVLIPYGNGHCPDVVRVRLTHVKTISVSSATADSMQVYNGNSLYDPDETGIGGEQPMGFDQWMAFYNNYKVFASRITIDALNMGSTEAVRIVVCPSTENGATLGVEEEIEESPYSKASKMLPPKTDPIRISHYMTTAKIKGYDGVLSESGFSGSATTNPVNRWYWNISTYNIDDTGTVATVFLEVRLDYYVEFYKKKALDRS